MPPLGMMIGKIDFSNLFIALDGKDYASLKAAADAGAPVLSYGLFINTVINFLIIAFSVFIVIKQINRFRPKPAPEPEHRLCPFCRQPRLCPFCRQPIADDATRCPHCTSEL